MSASVSAYRRTLLSSGWQLCAVAPAPAAGPSSPPPDDADWIAAPALGTAAAMLQAAGRWSLDAPALRFDAHDWWYRLRFDRPESCGHDDLILGFDGLATLCQAWLNGEPLLTSDSMFVAHECAVGPRLRASGNELLLRFASLDQALAARRPRPRWRTPMVDNQQLRWWRSTLLGRTPGWSPPCPPVGPWRDIWLEDRAQLRAELRQLRCSAVDGGGVLELHCELAVPGGVTRVELSLLRAEQRICAELHRVDAAGWQLELRLPEVALWWPHTHGEPALYAAALHVETHERGSFDVGLGRVGFRSIALRHDNDGDFGIVVNGVPVFCRGACWTPLDPVGFRAGRAETDRAVARCRTAGMNMLRIAGPMVYEDAALLDACDEHGILVWQDFMFANMDYPADDPAFLANVDAEVAQALAAWRGRPSLAVLCGNSEVSQQAAMWGAPREQWLPPLFSERIAAAVARALPEAAYWPSSAWGGSFPHQLDRGSASYYGVGAYLRPADDARHSRLRFASECLGFANVPQADTLARLPGGSAARVTNAAWKVRSPRDLGAGWDFDDVRDHYLARLFDVDPAKLRYADHERYLLLSRVASGAMMASAFAQWRRAGSSCRGALVWWLQDLWAGAGWGLVDDAGQPKACWHLLARALQPCTVLLTDEGCNGLFAQLLNERAEPLQATLDIAAWRNETTTHRARRELVLPAHSAQALPLAEMLDHFADLNHAYRFGPLDHDAVVASLRRPDGALLAQTLHFPAGMNLPRDPDLGLRAEATLRPDGSVQVALDTRRLAVAVHLEANGYEADDQYLHLVPGEARHLTLRPVGQAGRPWRCTVQALNASAPVVVRAPAAAAPGAAA